MVELVSLNKEGLRAFIQSEQFGTLDPLPISRHRAVSQIHNPRADEKDVLLVIATHQGKVVGYVGALPDYIYSGHQKQKTGWVSSFWVDPQYKTQKLAQTLFQRLAKEWGGMLTVTNSVPWMEGFYQRSGVFGPTLFAHGLRSYLRLNLAELLPPKRSFFKAIEPILSRLDGFFNVFNDWRLSRSVLSLKIDPSLCVLENLTSREAEFIFQNSHHLTKRTLEDLNWILAYPWVEQREQKDEDGKYYFSTHSARFQNWMYASLDAQGEVQGIVFLNLRENRLEVPYVFGGVAFKSKLPNLIKVLMVKHRVNMVSVIDQELSRIQAEQSDLFLYQKKIEKMFLISKVFGELEVARFQDGDGDGVFT